MGRVGIQGQCAGSFPPPFKGSASPSSPPLQQLQQYTTISITATMSNTPSTTGTAITHASTPSSLSGVVAAPLTTSKLNLTEPALTTMLVIRATLMDRLDAMDATAES
eukprot:Hpha_TRINITY_DN15056_c0_g2::TRINITY_DN15056_c0_g2_i1::g.126075::m.126075